MLGVSVQSGTSGSSSTWSEAVDLELVEEIIQRSSGATSFPLVYPAYEQVLNEHGLSSTSDSTYYHFLLKLGTIRATTWNEKWRIYKTTHPSSFLPPKSPPVPSPASRPLRARVPFLASASSDLDEGFATPSERDPSSQPIFRPSPRKIIERSRSLVGYTPTPSLLDDESKFDTADFDPPVRTSTPNRAYRRSQTPDTEADMGLPPYSVSEVSEVLLDEDDTRLIDGLSTPRANVRGIPSGYGRDEEELEADGEMERRADEFFVTGLMGRCWDVWSQSAHWIQQTTKRIDDARPTILLRQALLNWQVQTERNLNRANTAKAHDELHLKNQVLSKWLDALKTRKLLALETAYHSARLSREMKATWGKWRLRVGKRRMDRWKLDMDNREKGLIKRRDAKLMAGMLERWSEATRDRINIPIADLHRDRRLISQSIILWHDLARHKRSLATALEDWQNTERSKLLQGILAEWRRRARLAVLGKQAVVREEGILITRFWERWRLVKWQNSEAGDFNKRRLQRAAFAQWRSKLKRLRLMNRRGDTLVKKHDRQLLKQSLDLWITSERGKLLVTVRENRLVRQALGKWQAELRTISGLDSVAKSYTVRVDAKILHNQFSRWRAALGNQHTANLQATLVYERNTQAGTLEKWVQAIRKNKKDIVDADKARAFFLLRGVVGAWKVRLGERKRKRWEESRMKGELKGVWDVWRERTAQSIQDREAAEQLQTEQEKRLLSRYLDRWTERVVEIREREFVVTQKRDQAVVSDALARWRRHSKKIQEIKSLMRSHVDLKLEDKLRDVLLTWRDRARATKQRRELADKSISERTDRLLSETFATWRGVLREKRLAAVEAEVKLRREDGLLFSFWDTWISKSMHLKVLVFQKQRLRKLVWRKWRTAVVRAEELRRAQEPRNRRLMAEVMEEWRERTKERVAARMARQRNRPRHSAGVSEHRRVSSPLDSQPIQPRQTSVRRTTPYSRMGHIRSNSQSRPFSRIPVPDEDVEIRKSESVYSEPAYTRLRSELSARRRGGSEEPDQVRGQAQIVTERGGPPEKDVRSGTRRESGSELFRALRGTLPGR